MILQGRLLTNPHQTPQRGWVRIDEGRIAELGRGAPPQNPQAGRPESLIIPGFIDAHLHLSQIDVIGCDPPSGDGLLKWLEEVVFPAEIRWQDAETAQAQVRGAYHRLLQAGTLGYAGYLTSHPHGIDAVEQARGLPPLRGIVGQVLMDRNAPKALLQQRHNWPSLPPGGRVALSVNPRFAVACSDESLSDAAARTADGRFVQTHLAESQRECELVAELFPNDPHYTAVYDRHGLLTDRTLLAHCVHLSADEWRLIAERRSVVVHCPTANTFLRSGLFDLDAAREAGVRLALGSDVAAGADLAMPRVARAMIEVAKVRSMTEAPDAHIPSPAEAWTLITTGNADALGFSDAGRLEVGAAADLLVLNVPFGIDKHLIGRLIYTWDDDYITHRVVDGRFVACNASAAESGPPQPGLDCGQPDAVVS